MGRRGQNLNELVLDASVTLAWCFDDESPAAGEVLEFGVEGSFRVPAIWTYEVANGLAVAERRRRIKQAAAERFIALLAGLRIQVEPGPQLAAVPVLLGLGRNLALSVYDLAYLELAQRLGLPLATLDSDLAAAAKRAGVRLVK